MDGEETGGGQWRKSANPLGLRHNKGICQAKAHLVLAVFGVGDRLGHSGPARAPLAVIDTEDATLHTQLSDSCILNGRVKVRAELQWAWCVETIRLAVLTGRVAADLGRFWEAKLYCRGD